MGRAVSALHVHSALHSQLHHAWHLSSAVQGHLTLCVCCCPHQSQVVAAGSACAALHLQHCIANYTLLVYKRHPRTAAMPCLTAYTAVACKTATRSCATAVLQLSGQQISFAVIRHS